MSNEVSYLNLAGRRLRFWNPDHLYPVNQYQSLVLAACAEVAAVAMAARLGRRVTDLSAWEPCCGGGPVAVTLKALGLGHLSATDINADALKAIVANARANDLEIDEVSLGDLLNDGGSSRFDIIAVNPPCGVTLLSDNTDRAIHVAVDGGSDGMDLTLRLIQQARLRLTPTGSLILLVVSSGNISRLIDGLNAEFPRCWRVMPTTPVAGPWMLQSDPRATRAQEPGEYLPFLWCRPDGWLWRLSWVIEATCGRSFDQTGSAAPVTALPLHPYGYAVSKDPELREAICRFSADRYLFG